MAKDKLKTNFHKGGGIRKRRNIRNSMRDKKNL